MSSQQVGKRALPTTGVIVVVGLGIWILLRFAPTESSIAPEPMAQTGINHVILIVIDTLRADVPSYTGSDRTPTPNIDAVARDGIIFTQLHATSSWTLPTMTSMMTGLSPQSHLTYRSSRSLPEGVPTLAQYMRDDGYHTGAIGWNAMLNPKNGFNRGFLEYDIPAHPWYERTGHPEPDVSWLTPEFAKKPVFNSTSYIETHARAWLKQNAHRDLFGWLHFFDPHVPYMPPEKFAPSMEKPRGIGKAIVGHPEAMRAKTPEQRIWVEELYRAEAGATDAAVGRVVDTMKQLGIYDEALLIITADHGEEFWEHGKTGHGKSLYQDQLRVPLIVKLPASMAGPGAAVSRKPRFRHEVVETPVSQLGIMPMILNLCGIEGYDPDLDKTSLSPLIMPGYDTPTKAELYSMVLIDDKPCEAVIFGAKKLIRCPDKGIEELYDLQADPEESNNLVETDTEALDMGRSFLDAHHEECTEVRKKLGITGEGADVELDEKTRKELQALGYLASS